MNLVIYLRFKRLIMLMTSKIRYLDNGTKWLFDQKPIHFMLNILLKSIFSIINKYDKIKKQIKGIVFFAYSLLNW